MSVVQSRYGNARPTPATSIWLVIDNLPGEDDEGRQKLEELIRDLKKVVDAKVSESLEPSDRQQAQPARAGTAKTGKLRIFVEER